MHQLYVVAQVNTFMGSTHFGATYSIRVLEIFFLGVSHSNWHSRVQTCQSGQKFVSPNVITFDVNIDIELQTDEILWYVCKIKQKRQEKFKFITLKLITVEIRTWIRDFSWLFDINNHWLRIKTYRPNNSSLLIARYFGLSR